MFTRLLLILLLLAPPILAAEGGSRWSPDLDAALQTAGPEHKLVLVNFTGSGWSVWCNQLRDEILSKTHFLNFANKSLVLVELNFPRQEPLSPEQAKQNAVWAQKYSVQNYPTILVLDAAGKELGRTGYMQGGPKTFVRELKRIALKGPAPAGQK